MGIRMHTFTSADAKNNFGELIDLVRTSPVAITKYERPVVVVCSIVKALDAPASSAPRRKAKVQ